MKIDTISARRLPGLKKRRFADPEWSNEPALCMLFIQFRKSGVLFGSGKEFKRYTNRRVPDLHPPKTPAFVRFGDFRLIPLRGYAILCFKGALIKSTGQIGEQIFRLSKPQNRRNTLCISRFWGKDRRKICRQDAPGDLFRGSLNKRFGEMG